MIVSDSEVEDPEDYLEKNKERLKIVVARRREAIKRRGRYLKAKKLAEQKFLARRQCKRTDSIIHRYPDIGKVIEDFVEQRNIGADAWRRTGVLTFDGNTSVGKKVTFRRIQQHLQQVYNQSFSYGTVVQLCVPRNLRRKSAKLYKSVARVTCRRARKGFEMKYNPDRHWSAALYRNLNKVQYKDGRNIVNINRDDAAGYRLDTMTTHSLHRTHVVDHKQALTTHTDYVNRYPSILQTTSYNFSRTENTEEMCAGIVKSSGIFPKNPAQHACDLQMLQHTTEFSSMFVNPVTGEQKMIECIRVDGASDEGPSHEEVQFYWTERHLERNLYATIVSARCSGSSYLNRVELQNGCLALGHANLFIPSTLSGSNMDPRTGRVNLEQYKKNMDLATEVYINRVNDSPCGGTAIKLYKGADSSDHQKRRPLLLKFLKGSKQDKRHLEQEHKQLYDYFCKIWKLRSDHMVKEYPVNYLFCLFACCGTSMCIHPLCQHHDINMVWYQGGPLVKHIPLPICDKNRPWGNPDCAECKGVCGGHFLKDVFESDSSPMVQPPSVILKKAFQSLKGALPTSEQIKKLAEECLLPIEEVTMWMDHLKQIANNRKRGAMKAAETRKKKKAAQTEVVCCVVCHSPYVNFTEQVENWIQCDSCDSWTHFSCVGIVESDKLPDAFYCSLCCEAT